ncbi:ankyrin repeat and LEM domain-containing protein 1 [Suncus etruscus]|uniref:ankyrin repeat and LEM domain-containing protein 1 n=1 Tax=Suncus etruscus TaxID=109475 RepID=UPI00210FB653|nr:ankyrin repeat and LEM domain-containing protein 1 [Suncus etruscus]
MGAAGAELALQLRAALRAEEPRAVDQLLRRGADPNLVLEDGAAAVHLAARARRPRPLRCLTALLRAGGDPNARSAEALTPLHVAAAWGCRRGLELLLRRGADPELQDQDGLRALDLAEQQGHEACVRVLQGLAPPVRTWTPLVTAPETQQPDPDAPLSRTTSFAPQPDSAQGMGPASSRALDSPGQRGRDARGEAGPGSPNCCAHPPPVLEGSSEDASFVTAVEDPVPGASTPAGRGSLDAGPELEQVGVPEKELGVRLQALTLDTPSALRAPSPARASLGTESCLDGALTALWPAQTECEVGAGEPPGVPESDLELLRGLRALGATPGPVTPFTRPHYVRRLQEARIARGPDFSRHSPELAEALRTGQIPDAQADEDVLTSQFERPDLRRAWRGGVAKASFTYLLLDPRETQDLPSRAATLGPTGRLRTFVRAIFYVGKGSRARPDSHLWEALGHLGRPGRQPSPKVQRILDIWAAGRGVVSLHCFQHTVAAEAYTREACLVAALGLGALTNQKQGHCYGVAASWPLARRCRLGVYLLHRALHIFLAEGQRELRPGDVQERG